MNFNFVNVTFVQTVRSLFQEFKLSMFRSMIQLRYPTGRYQKRWEKPWKNNIQMLAEHSAQLNIRNPKLRRHRNHCGFLCACSLKQVYKGIQRSVELRKIKISFTSNKEAWTLNQIGIESILIGVWQKQLRGFLFVKDILPRTPRYVGNFWCL